MTTEEEDTLKLYWEHFFRAETGTYEKSTWLDLFLAEFLIRLNDGVNPKELIKFCPVSGVVSLVGCELLCGIHRVTSSINTHYSVPLPTLDQPPPPLDQTGTYCAETEADLAVNAQTETLTDLPTHTPQELVTDSQAAVEEECFELDQDMLEILGIDPTSKIEYGPDINDKLATRLQFMCTNGIEKDEKKEVLKSYSTPANCPLSAAPHMNAEIHAALNENQQKRDKALETRQIEIASAISSLSYALSDMMTKKDFNKKECTKKLMDCARLLCNLQFEHSNQRKNLSTNTLKKDVKEHLMKSKVDKYLFGETLPETLKTAKAVSKSSIEIRAVPARPASTYTKAQPKHLNSKAAPGRATRAPQTAAPRMPRSARPPAPAPPRPAASSNPSSRRPTRQTHRRR